MIGDDFKEEQSHMYKTREEDVEQDSIDLEGSTAGDRDMQC